MFSKDLLLEIISMLFIIYDVTGDGFYIRTSPNSKEVEEGAQLMFDCRATPSHKIVYRWKHEDDFVQYDHHRYLDYRNNRTLLFDHADRDLDPGNYYCLAQNSSSQFSRKSKTATLRVHWMDPSVQIKLIQPPLNVDIKIGTNVLLKCDVEANPKVTKENIYWYLNGKNLPSDIRIQTDGTLLIESVKASHIGFYHCSILHVAGKLDSLYPFIINLDSDTKLLPQTFTLFETKSARVTLKCPWNGQSITWSKIQRLGDPFTMISSENLKNTEIRQDSLTIMSMDETSDYYYICQSANKTTIKEAFFKVSLAQMYDFIDNHFSPTLGVNDPLVIRKGEDGYIRFYQDFTPSNSFIFDQIPNPFPQISWSFNDQPIVEWSLQSKTPLPHKYVHKSRHLIIQNSQIEDRGTYIIKMSNKAGERVRAFRVEITFAPEFKIQQINDRTISEGSSVTLDCGIRNMAGEGLTKIYWKKDNLTIGAYVKNIIYSNEQQILQITDARPEHTGSYQCFVQTIKYPVYTNKPQKIIIRAKLKFLEDDSDVFLELNKDGQIPCKTKGHGKIEIRWSKFDPNRKRKISIKDATVLTDGTLLLRETNAGANGDYICEAVAIDTNEKINKTVHVQVGEKPKITQISSNTTVQEGSTVYMDCQATGYPKPTFNWLVDNINYQGKSAFITYNSKQSESHTGNLNNPIGSSRKKVFGNGTLVIYNVILEDEGRYACRAINHRSLWDEQSIQLKVLTPEEFTKFKQGTKFNRGMVKTIVIVVSCAIAYLALIVGLTAFCSLRMLRHRRNRALNDKLGDNRQLMQPISTSTQPHRYNTNLPGGTSALLSHPPLQHTRQQHTNTNNSLNYLPQLPIPTTSNNSATTPSNYYTQYSIDNPNNLQQQLPLLSSYQSSQQQPLHLQQLVSAPPPTPLESRSNMSSTNSAYTRSQFSSSTNGNCTTSGIGGGGANTSGSIGGAFCGFNMSSMERLTYPRHELQTEAFLGKGEFGDVLLARARNIQDGESQSLVVVKSLMSSANDQQGLCHHEFHRQLDLLARVENDCVTKLLGICIEIEPYLLIMEYCEWGDLKQLLKCARDRNNSPHNMLNVTRPQKLLLCEQIANGMEAIALQHCVHKDLAARNILITPQMKAKVALIGLCREGGHSSDYYLDGDRPLPLRWMSPEAIIRGELSIQSDVWSYAVTLTEIFAGNSNPPLYPTSHEEILDILTSSVNLNNPRINTLYSSLYNGSTTTDTNNNNNNMPNKLNLIVKKCLNIDLNKRPTFSEIKQELNDIISETKV